MPLPWPRPAKDHAAGEANGTLLGQSLLRLEINTIIKDGMTGEPMPPLPHALLDLALQYLETLGRHGLALDATVAGWTLADGARATRYREARPLIAPTFERFGDIRDGALALLAARAEALAGPDRAVVERIVECCEAIQDVIKRLPRDGLLWQHLALTRAALTAPEPGTGKPRRLGPYDISPVQLLRLRKLWDIGTETIVAQTSISLGGDVVVRVSPMLTRPENQLLLAIHREAVATSTAYWKDLLATAVSLVSAGARLVMGGAAGRR